MPLPFILWGAAAVATAVGIGKGLDAKDNFDRAKRIGDNAEQKLKTAKNDHSKAVENLQNKSQELGKLKLDVFRTEIAHTIEVLKSIKKSRSKLAEFQTVFTENEIKSMEHSVHVTFEISNAGDALAGAALAGIGVYSAVGVLASASTGTAIASLSGAAATNATLAWLGGGSLATGGFGMAGGMIALGGIVLAPAIFITGFVLASKAEEALSEAQEFSAKVDVAVEEIKGSIVMIQHILNRIEEFSLAINQLREKFKSIKVPVGATNEQAIKSMLVVAKSLKDVLDINIISADGKINNDSGRLLLNAKSKGLEVIRNY